LAKQSAGPKRRIGRFLNLKVICHHSVIGDVRQEKTLVSENIKTQRVAKLGRWKWPLLIVGVSVLGVCGFVYVAKSSYPLYRANRTPGRAWSAWDAADHNVDGTLTLEEMERFGKQMPHRDVDQLLRNFDAADTNHDGIVMQEEIDAYGTDVGSRDPSNR
jgi:hypothetical protein